MGSEEVADLRAAMEAAAANLTAALDPEVQGTLGLICDAHTMLRQALDDPLATEPCDARLFHGPGHQSATPCRLRGEHEVHEAVYHESTLAQWRGDEAMTGFFDEPPELEDE